MPNKYGYFRDDNSLLKVIPRSLPISSPLDKIYPKKKIGKGFVCSHIWRYSVSLSDSNNILAGSDADLYSFIPNLVWLPSQVSKLTDREGSFTQLYLQALSYKIYRNVKLPPKLEPIVESVWEKLPPKPVIPASGLPAIDDLTYFNDNEGFVNRRIKKIQEVLNAFEDIENGRKLDAKVISKRYTYGIQLLKSEMVTDIIEKLRNYYYAIL